MTPTLIAMKTLILPEPYPEMKTRLMAAMATVTFADIAVIGRPDARNDTTEQNITRLLDITRYILLDHRLSLSDQHMYQAMGTFIISLRCNVTLSSIFASINRFLLDCLAIDYRIDQSDSHRCSRRRR